MEIVGESKIKLNAYKKKFKRSRMQKIADNAFFANASAFSLFYAIFTMVEVYF